MCDALVERVAQHFALHVERAVVAEVVPEAKRDGGQDQTRIADAAIDHVSVAIRRSAPRIQGVWHACVVEIDAHAVTIVACVLAGPVVTPNPGNAPASHPNRAAAFRDDDPSRIGEKH